MQDWGAANPLTWNDPAWSISAELGAYLVFPLMTMTLDWRRLPCTVVIVAVFGLFCLLHLIFSYMGAVTLGADIAHLGLVRCLIEFTVGGALCSLWERATANTGVLAAMAAMLALALAFAAATSATWLPETLGVPTVMASGLLALASSSSWRWNPLASAPLHWLAEVSYATYLSHYLFWFAFKLALVGPQGASPTLLTAYAVTLLAISATLYHGLERPAQRAINRWPLMPTRSQLA